MMICEATYAFEDGLKITVAKSDWNLFALVKRYHTLIRYFLHNHPE